MLSGVGPAAEIEEHKIELVHELPGVGQHLHDRLFLPMPIVRKEGTHHRSLYINGIDGMANVREQWNKDHSGPLSAMYLPQMICYMKSDAILNSKEFAELNPTMQEALQSDTKPNFEVLSHSPSPIVSEPEHYISLAVAFDCVAAGGSLTLGSGNIDDPPVIDPKYLSHPFDRRVAIEAVRETLGLLQQPNIFKDQVRLAVGPKSTSDEDILVRACGFF